MLSGGLDSMCILKEKGKDFFQDIVFIDYGQRFLEKEYSVCKSFITKVITIDTLKDKDGFFFGRNLRFFIAIREAFIDQNIVVYFGNNSDDNYNDNTYEFIQRVEKIINDSYPYTLRINCPYKDFSKEEIYNKALELNVNDYYYCDLGLDEPCGKCHSCIAMIDAGLLKIN